MNITFQDCSPFGIKIAGIQLSDAADHDIANLKQLLAHNGVVIIQNQSIDDAEFVTFLKRLGSLMFTTGETPVSHQPWLNLVTNVGRDRAPRSVFHTDTS